MKHNTLSAAMVAILLSVAGNLSAETKVTDYALNWESQPLGESETVRQIAPYPGGKVLFIRDVGGGTSSDQFVILENGHLCSAVIPSTSFLNMMCGDPDNVVVLIRTDQIRFRREKELPDAAAPETPKAPTVLPLPKGKTKA